MAHLHENTIIAGLIGLAVGLIKLLEVVISSVWKKYFEKKDEGSSSNGHYCQLDPETARAMREVQEDHIRSMRETRNDINDVAQCIKEVSRSQERLAECMERMTDDHEESSKKIRNELSDLTVAIRRGA